MSAALTTPPPPAAAATRSSQEDVASVAGTPLKNIVAACRNESGRASNGRALGRAAESSEIPIEAGRDDVLSGGTLDHASQQLRGFQDQPHDGFE